MQVPNDFQERAHARSGCGGIGVPHRHADGGFRIGRMQALPYRRIRARQPLGATRIGRMQALPHCRIYAASLANRVSVRRLESVMKRT